MKSAAAILFLFISFISNAQTFNYVEKMPVYPGGENEMLKFISKNIQYPEIARENGIEGKVVIQFVVMKDGNVDSIKVQHGVGYGCDEEVIRVIKLMPKWTPGEMGGNTVNTYFMLPVTFKLGDDLPPVNTDDIEVTVSNSDSDETLAQLANQLKEKNLYVQFKKVKRNKDGTIKSIFIGVASAYGEVHGTYKKFTAIKIYRTKTEGLGISPTPLSIEK